MIPQTRAMLEHPNLPNNVCTLNNDSRVRWETLRVY